jgi:hypothetical protein
MISDSINTVVKRAINRRRLNVGALRNSIKLGLATVYSTTVKIAAKIATRATTRRPS